MAILKGSQRGGARDLAIHLMKPENDHIEVHEIRGFSANTVMGALNEAYAVSRATKCKRFMYSLSANPPPSEAVTTDDLVRFINRSEAELGLQGQPRVIVFHEKHGRRHAHCVWSRIKTDTLTAVHIPHDYPKLTALTRDIFIERGWTMPKGLAQASRGHPRNFTLAQWQQAKRKGKDPKTIRRALEDAWAISDSKAAFLNALSERGFTLARGDKRGFIVVDETLEPYSLSRWCRQKPKALKARLGDPKDLSSFEEAKNQISQDMRKTLSRIDYDVQRRANDAQNRFEARRQALVKKQHAERDALKRLQEMRRSAANKARQERFRRGLSALWDHLRGEYKRIRRANELEAYKELQHNRADMDALIFRHLKERQRIEIFKLRHKERAQSISRQLSQDRRAYVPMPEP